LARCVVAVLLMARAFAHLRVEGHHATLRVTDSQSSGSPTTYLEEVWQHQGEYNFGVPLLASFREIRQSLYKGFLSHVGKSQVGVLKFAAVSQGPQTEETIKQQYEHPRSGPVNMEWQILYVFIEVAIMAVVAKIYITFRRLPMGEYGSEDYTDYNRDWKHGCCSWYQEPGTCLCGLCCFPLRWAETVSLVKGVLPFWPAFLLFMILAAFGETVVFLFAWLGMVVVCVDFRQRLRKSFDFEKQGGITWLTDCLMYSFCSCCAVIQEARHVEDALARKHVKTECPADRKTSLQRRACWTCRPFDKQEGSSYTNVEKVH